MFRHFKLFSFVVFFAAAGLSVQGAKAQSTDIQNTIAEQIEAFQADDFVGAFQYASPNLQRMFGTPDNFRMMVTKGYPMVWRPVEVRYLDLAQISGDYWQKVLIKDQQGRIHVLGYRMLETEMGWKINGVQLLPQPDVSA